MNNANDEVKANTAETPTVVQATIIKPTDVPAPRQKWKPKGKSSVPTAKSAVVRQKKPRVRNRGQRSILEEKSVEEAKAPRDYKQYHVGRPIWSFNSGTVRALPRGQLRLKLVDYVNLTDKDREILSQYGEFESKAGPKTHPLSANFNHLLTTRIYECALAELQTAGLDDGTVTHFERSVRIDTAHSVSWVHFNGHRMSDNEVNNINKKHNWEQVCNSSNPLVCFGRCGKPHVSTSMWVAMGWSPAQLAEIVRSSKLGVHFAVVVPLIPGKNPWNIQSAEMVSELRETSVLTSARDDPERWVECYNDWMMRDFDQGGNHVAVRHICAIGDAVLLEFRAVSNPSTEKVVTLDFVSTAMMYLGTTPRTAKNFSLFLRTFKAVVKREFGESSYAVFASKWGIEYATHLFYNSVPKLLDTYKSIDPEIWEDLDEMPTILGGEIPVHRVLCCTVTRKTHRRFQNLWSTVVKMVIVGLAAACCPLLHESLFWHALFWPLMWLVGDFCFGSNQLSLMLPTSVYKQFVYTLADVCRPAELEPMDRSATIKKPKTYVHGSETCHLDSKIRHSTCVSYGLLDCLPIRPRACFHMVETALRNRILASVDYSVDAWNSLVLPECIEQFLVQTPIFPLSIDEWLTRFEPSKQAAILRDIEESDAGRVDQELLLSRRAFPKDEFYLCKNTFSARAIQGFHGKYNSLTGPWIVPWTKSLSEHFNRYHPLVFYTSGSNPVEIGAWVQENMEAGAFFAESDFAKFERSISAEAIENVECRIYERSGAPVEVLECIRLQAETHGSTRCGFRYSVKGRRSSGAANTSGGNSSVHVVVIINALLESGLQIGQFRIMVNGDDGVIAFYADFNVKAFVNYLDRLGFSVVVAIRDNPEDVEFCSSVFWPTTIGLVMGPKVGRALSKNLWDKAERTHVEHQQWTLGVALGMRASWGFIPVLAQVVDVIIQDFGHLQAIDPQLSEYNFYVPEDEKIGMTRETERFFFDRYGWHSWHYNVDTMGLKSGPQWDKMIEMDCGSPRAPTSDLCVSEVTVTRPLTLLPGNNEYSLLFAPVTEELLKRSFYPFCYAAGYVLTAYGVANVMDLCMVIGFCFTVYMAWFVASYESSLLNETIGRQAFRIILHVVLATSPLLLGIVAHFVWNAFSLAPRSNPFMDRDQFDAWGPKPLSLYVASKIHRMTKKKSKAVAKNSARKQARAAPGRSAAYKREQATRASGPLENLGAMVGRALGYPQLGRSAGKFFGQIVGSGDYKVSENSLLSNGVPMFKRGEHAVRVVNREYVCDITSDTGFAIAKTLFINPGDPITFPWLSSLAQFFQEWRPRGVVVEFVSTSADALNSTNTALGQVVVASQYDPERAAWSTKQEMETSEFSCSGRPSNSFMHPIECARGERTLQNMLMRTPGVSGYNRRFEDLCFTSVAAVNTQAASVVGEVWITYDVDLIKPYLPAGSSIEDFSVVINTVPSGNNFGTLGTVFGNQGYSLVSTTKFAFPVNLGDGVFQVTVVWFGNSATPVLGTTTLTNCVNATTVSADYNIINNPTIFNPVGVAQTTCTYTTFIQITGSGAQVALTGFTVPNGGGNNSCTIIVTQITQGL